MEELRRASDHIILDLTKEVGSLTGTVNGIKETLDKVADGMQKVPTLLFAVDDLRRDVTQHDKRIVSLEKDVHSIKNGQVDLDKEWDNRAHKKISLGVMWAVSIIGAVLLTKFAEKIF